jgi:PAS domain S-box-containing protein
MGVRAIRAGFGMVIGTIPERRSPARRGGRADISKNIEGSPGNLVKLRIVPGDEPMKTPDDRPLPADRDEKFLALCTPLSAGAGALAFLTGLLTLAGWLYGIEPLLWAPAGMVVMKANAALCFLLAGSSLILLTSGHKGKAPRLFAGALALVVALVGLVTLVEYLTGWDPGIDQMLAREMPGAVKTSSPGRMAPNVAVAFLMTGISLLLLALRSGPWVVSGLGALSGMVALHGLLGFAYASEAPYGFLTYTHIAFQTALALMALSVGVLLALGDRGMMEPFSRKGVGAVQARRMLPAVVVVPFLLAWVRYEGMRRGLFADEFGVALMVVASSATLAVAGWAALLVLNRSDLGRSRAFDAMQSEQRFRKAIESSILTGIVATDREGKITYVNPAFCRLVRREEAALVGKGPPYPFAHPEERRSLSETGAALRRAHRSRGEFEFRLLRSDGETLGASVFLSRLRDSGGKVIGTLGAVTDITEKKHQRRELSRATEILERVFGNMRFGVVYLDPEFNYVRVNRAFADSRGFSPLYFLGKNHFRLYPSPGNEAIFRKVIETGEPFARFAEPFEDPRRPGLGVSYLDWTLQPVLEKDGSVIGLIYCSDDVTQRVRAESRLKESEQRLEMSVKAADMGIWEWNIRTDEVVYSDQCAEILGYAPAEMEPSASAARRLVHPEDLPKVIAALEAHFERGAPFYEAEFRMKAKAGDWRWIRSRGTVIERDEAGRPVRATGIHQDFTRAREMELAMFRQEKMAMLGQMAAGIAHEIRNPLSGLNLYLAAAVKLSAEAEFEDPGHHDALMRSLGTARSASVKIESVIRRVMDFVKPSPPRLGSVAVNEVVAEALEMVAVTARKGGVAITTSLAEGLPPCRADAGLLEQLVLNLLTNAMQAVEKGEREKKVEVATAADGGSVVVKVSDSGPGVSRELRDRIFDPFFTTKPTGTGLGLSITGRIVSDLGGTIVVGESVLGGAEFTVRLPASG